MKICKKIKLGIVGHGFVGKATDLGFNKNVEKYIVDPKYSTLIKDLQDFRPEIVFVCVPTPMGKDGLQDSSIIRTVIRELNKYASDAVICIKSTVIPSVLKSMASLNPNIVYNPEFLREKHAKEDFINSEFIVFGGNKDYAEIVSRAYKENSSCITKEHFFVDLISASLIKYAINTFLATKVTYFNELHDYFSTQGIEDSWNDITEIITKDSRIGKSHTSVPGHDGRFGFGGACFPKDCAALLADARSSEVDLSVLNASINKNNKIRSKYQNLDKREIEQNVSYQVKGTQKK